MAELIEVLTDAGVQIVTILVGALISWLALKIREWLKTEENATKLKQKERYARLAVEAVELMFNELEGEQKLIEAKERLLKWAEKNQIPIGEDELRVLIESAVVQLKKEGKEIKSVYDEQTWKGLIEDGENK